MKVSSAILPGKKSEHSIYKTITKFDGSLNEQPQWNRIINTSSRNCATVYFNEGNEYYSRYQLDESNEYFAC